jgi:hypothetical protein
MNSPARFPTPPPLPGGALARFPPPPPPPPPLPFQQIAQPQQQPLLLGTTPPFTLDSWTPWIVIAITSTLAITILTLFIYMSFSTSHEDNAKEKSAREKERRLKEEEEEQEERREELAALKLRVKQQEEKLAQLEKNYSDHLEKMSQRMKENEDTLTLVAMTMSMRDQGQKEQKEKLDAALAKIPRPARMIEIDRGSFHSWEGKKLTDGKGVLHLSFSIVPWDTPFPEKTERIGEQPPPTNLRQTAAGGDCAFPSDWNHLYNYNSIKLVHGKCQIVVPVGQKIKLMNATLWHHDTPGVRGDLDFSDTIRHLFDE